VKLEKPFYVENIGSRWTSIPTDYRTLAEAENAAAHFSRDAMESRVFDCTAGPIGVLVSVYCRGVRKDPP